MTEIAIGPAVEQRYKELGLTQETLAWIAGVSNSTVRNALASRVGKRRTWPSIERALAWRSGSLERMQDGLEPEEAMPTEAARAILKATLRLHDADNDRAARRVLTLYTNIQTLGRDDDQPDAFIDGMIRDNIRQAWPAISEQLTPSEAEPLAEVFRDYGWRGEVIRSSTHYSPHFAGAPSAERTPKTTPRLPSEVQELLDRGYVLDYGVVAAPSSHLKFVVMAVQTGDSTMGDSTRAVTVIDAVRQTVNPGEWLSAQIDPPKIDMTRPIPREATVTTKRDMAKKWRVVVEDMGRPLAISPEGYDSVEDARAAAERYISAVGFDDEVEELPAGGRPPNDGWIYNESQLTDKELTALRNVIVEGYQAGRNIHQLSQATRCTYGFIHRLLTDAGVELRGRSRSGDRST